MESNHLFIEKKTLRKTILEIRDNIKKDYKIFLDDAIYQKVILDNFFIESSRVLIYNSMGSEIDTKKIIEHSFKNDKKVYLPYVNDKTKALEFYRAKPQDKLKKSKFSVLEPYPEKSNLFLEDMDRNSFFNETVCIVPSLATDRNNYRLGYGGGFYDKFLAKNDHLKTICVCYSFFMLKKIPIDIYDIKCQKIISD